MQLAEFNDRFNEVNSELLTCIAAFNPKSSFDAFEVETLVELAKAYPADFNPKELNDLRHDLGIYIDNVRADASLLNWIPFLSLVVSWWQKRNTLGFL